MRPSWRWSARRNHVPPRPSSSVGVHCVLVAMASMVRGTAAIREMTLVGVLAAAPYEAGYSPTVDSVGSGNEIREFLTTRRARVTPERAGLRAYGGRRRVSGLRREEVALLAGISAEYYTRLERGNARGVSESVLEGIARALQLDEAEG